MSILRDPSPVIENDASAFLIAAAQHLFDDSSFCDQVDSLKSAESEDAAAAMVAHQSMALASKQLNAQNQFPLVMHVKTRSNLDANMRSLSKIFGEAGIELILQQPSLRNSLPAHVEAFMKSWKFDDESYMVEISSTDPAFGIFCEQCFNDPQLLIALDRHHRHEHEGDPLSAAALEYMRKSLTETKLALIPIPAGSIHSFLAQHSVGPVDWLKGYQVMTLEGQDLSPQDLINKHS